MTELRLAVFDCDGTLVDSQASIIACVDTAWREEGLEPGPNLHAFTMQDTGGTRRTVEAGIAAVEALLTF